MCSSLDPVDKGRRLRSLELTVEQQDLTPVSQAIVFIGFSTHYERDSVSHDTNRSNDSHKLLNGNEGIKTALPSFCTAGSRNPLRRSLDGTKGC